MIIKHRKGGVDYTARVEKLITFKLARALTRSERMITSCQKVLPWSVRARERTYVRAPSCSHRFSILFPFISPSLTFSFTYPLFMIDRVCCSLSLFLTVFVSSVNLTLTLSLSLHSICLLCSLSLSLSLCLYTETFISLILYPSFPPFLTLLYLSMWVFALFCHHFSPALYLYSHFNSEDTESILFADR